MRLQRHIQGDEECDGQRNVLPFEDDHPIMEACLNPMPHAGEGDT